MKVIGLTGGIASGKSTVSRFLAGLGAVIIDADRIGHQFLENDGEARQQVVDAFGRQILKPNGEIDRKKLGRTVFKSPEALSRLNQIMHRRIYDMVKTQLEQHQKQGVNVVVVEAPLLIEAGWTSLVDEVWVTVAPRAIVLKRLGQVGLSRAESLARIRSQLPARERNKQANVLINTDRSLGELKGKVSKLWQKL